METTETVGALGQVVKRTTPFKDSAGVKDASGKGINLTLLNGKYYTPHGIERILSVKDVSIRPDDLIVCGYPKTGCHWVWETLVMILKGKAEYATYLKLATFLEMSCPELYDAVPSPRVLNCHNEYDELPDEAKRKKTKIILTVRNPKDTAVSFYNHHINLKELYGYDGQFSDWFQLYLDGKVDYGDFFNYHLSWEEAINNNPDHPILVVKYEEMKRDTPGTIRTIAKFINADLDESQVNAIAGAAEFGTMKQKFKNKATEKLIRKGEVGDWKNWLTAEQVSELDKRSNQLLTGTRFEPIDQL